MVVAVCSQPGLCPAAAKQTEGARKHSLPASRAHGCPSASHLTSGGPKSAKRAQLIRLITSANLKFPSRTSWLPGAQPKAMAGQGAGEHGEVLSPKPAPGATRELFPVPGLMVRARAGSPTDTTPALCKPGIHGIT